MARQATTANGILGGFDDESSQAEGTVEGGAGAVRQDNINSVQNQQNNNNSNNPHYENIYESIEQYAVNNVDAANNVAAAVAGPANVPADNLHNNSNNNNTNSPHLEIGGCAGAVGGPIQPMLGQKQKIQQNHIQPQSQLQNRSNNLNIGYRNDLYDRTNNSSAYDVPRPLRNGIGIRRNNLQLDLHSNRLRYGAALSGLTAGGGIPGNSGASVSGGHGVYRQRSFDDTESQNYYNFNYSNQARYENIYEQIREEPIYRNAGRVYGRLNVIGHGIGRIERHLSSSCGNIDHYNLGGHYAVLGHSHFGTVGHIRLNAGANNNVGPSGLTSNNGKLGAGTNCTGAGKNSDGVKTSNSSFFSCLGGENSQSLSNIYRVTGGGSNAAASNSFQNVATTSRIPLSSVHQQQQQQSPNQNGVNSVGRSTGAIPKNKNGKLSSNSNTNTQSNNNTINTTKSNKSSNSVVTGNNSTTSSNPEHTSTLNRISKSSLQWLLVNKWLPLWMGQGPDCKVIDFNFMFSRNCDGCHYSSSSTASAPSNNNTVGPTNNQIGQDLVRFNGINPMTNSVLHTRRDPSGRPLRSTLSRLRESEYHYQSPGSLRRAGGNNNANNNGAGNINDENNYENVHVHFQNGFEFGRSRENYDNRPQLLRARSESPTFSQRVCKQRNINSQYSDPFKNYELNTENNTFKPKGLSEKKITFNNFASTSKCGFGRNGKSNLRALDESSSGMYGSAASGSDVSSNENLCDDENNRINNGIDVNNCHTVEINIDDENTADNLSDIDEANFIDDDKSSDESDKKLINETENQNDEN